MSDQRAPESSDAGHEGEDTELRDSVFLLTPTADIYQRIEPEALIEFVLAVDGAIREEFADLPAGEGVELQVGCALLPSLKKLVEGRIEPAYAADRHVERLAQAIDGLKTPDVSGGPVAFSRRCVLGAGLNPSPGFGLPFYQFLRRPGLVLLDDLLMNAGATKPASQSFWGKLPPPPAATMHFVVVRSPVEPLWRRIVGSFRGEKRPARTIAEQEITSRLRERTGRAVTVCNGRMAMGF